MMWRKQVLFTCCNYSWFRKGVAELGKVPGLARIGLKVFADGLLLGGETLQSATRFHRVATGHKAKWIAFDGSCEDVEDERFWDDNLAKKRELIEDASRVGFAAFVAIKVSAFGHPTKRTEETERRLKELGTCALENRMSLLVDAEKYESQIPLSNMIVRISQKHFVGVTRPPMYNTYQMYLKDSLERLACDVALAKEHGFPLGIKLVRGAYLQTEARDRIFPDKSGTDTAYEEATDMILNEIAQGTSLYVVFATHNKNSVGRVLNWLDNHRDKRKNILFATIFGMGSCTIDAIMERGYFEQTVNLILFGQSKDLFPWVVRRLDELGSPQGATQQFELPFLSQSSRTT